MKRFIFVFLSLIIFLSFAGCGDGVKEEHDSISYDICATLDSNTYTLTGEVSVDYTYVGESTLNSLIFALHPNRYQDGCMVIDGVFIDGKQVGFSIEKEVYIEVVLPYEMFGGDSVNLVINWRTTILENNAIYGKSDNEIRLSGWYPILSVRYSEWCMDESKYGDYLFSECADYTVRLTVDSDYIVASSGKRVSQTNSSYTTTYTYDGDNMRDFALALSKEYKVVSGVVGGTLVSSYAYTDESAKNGLLYAQQSLSYYSERYGTYPYPTYSVCATKIDEGGMEFSGLTYINCELIGIELEEVVAHETAHQWWYGLVGSNPTIYAWLDEGLTEYATLLYMENYHKGEWRVDKITKSHQAYSTLMDVESRLNDRVDIPMSQANHLFRSNYEYAMVTYVKGMLFFENLDSITNGKLDGALREYARSFTYKIATPEDLKRILESRARLSLTSVFDSWENGKVVFCY